MHPLGADLDALLALATLRLLDGGDCRDVLTSTDLHERVLASHTEPGLTAGLYELNNW